MKNSNAGSDWYQTVELKQQHGEGVEIITCNDKIRIVTWYIADTEILIDVYVKENRKWKPINKGEHVNLEEVLPPKDVKKLYHSPPLPSTSAILEMCKVKRVSKR